MTESNFASNARTKPQILSEEDKPFIETKHFDRQIQGTPKLYDLREQRHSHEVENFKNFTGKHLLYGAMAVIVLFGIIDARWHIDAPMFTSAFEVVKMVATTVLGYLFGSRFKS